MKRPSFARWPCSIARTVDVLGDRWVPLVLRESFYGIRRFDDYQRELGIARNTLADRLRMLVDQGLLKKELYDREPPRYEYLLTDKGSDTYGVLAAMSRWGDRWLAGDEGPPIAIRHASCGHDTHAEVVCAECRQPLRADQITNRMGPGYPERLKTRPNVQRRFSSLDS